jgi:hypothetical protein
MQRYLLVSKTGSLRVEISRQTDSQACKLAEERSINSLDYEVYRFDQRTDSGTPWRKIAETIDGKIKMV